MGKLDAIAGALRPAGNGTPADGGKGFLERKSLYLDKIKQIKKSFIFQFVRVKLNLINLLKMFLKF
jgi:hypothetical protein